MYDVIMKYAQDGAELRTAYFSEYAQSIEAVAKELAQCLASGHKILICGNGGSAADAQHFAAELVGRFLIERRSLPAIALTVDTSILTAVGNDYGYDEVFSRQIEGLGKTGDILIALSTSGNSKNILHAIKSARQQGLRLVGLCGKSGGEMLNKCDHLFHVHSNYTPFIQEMHEATLHLLCLLIDRYLFEVPLHQEN